MNITLIIGLPASGKTHLANTLGCLVIDDPVAEIDLPMTIDDFAITDPYFCRTKTLEAAIIILEGRYKKADIELIYFENDPVAARRNASLRSNHKSVNGLITWLTMSYDPPSQSIPIFKGYIK